MMLLLVLTGLLPQLIIVLVVSTVCLARGKIRRVSLCRTNVVRRVISLDQMGVHLLANAKLV